MMHLKERHPLPLATTYQNVSRQYDQYCSLPELISETEGIPLIAKKNRLAMRNLYSSQMLSPVRDSARRIQVAAIDSW
jgi:hypothetical protein